MLTDRRAFPHSLHHRRRSPYHHNFNPLRRAIDDAPRPHCPLCRAYRIPCRCADYLRVRCRWCQVEGIGFANGTGGRGVWRCGWNTFWRVGWSYPDSVGLVSTST